MKDSINADHGWNETQKRIAELLLESCAAESLAGDQRIELNELLRESEDRNPVP